MEVTGIFEEKGPCGSEQMKRLPKLRRNALPGLSGGEAGVLEMSVALRAMA